VRPRWQPNWVFARRFYRWARLERLSNSDQTGAKATRSMEQLEAENRRLRAENARLLEQREILKKSLGILSELPESATPASNR
jgi:transposase-like protein